MEPTVHPAVIAAIITSSLAMTLGVITTIISTMRQNKSMIAAERIKNVDNLRKSNIAFTSLVEIPVIHCNFKNSTQQNYVTALCAAVSALKTWIKPLYSLEKELISLIDDLRKLCLQELDNYNSINTEEFEKMRVKYDLKFALFTHTHWKIVQKDYDKRFKKSPHRFMSIYTELKKELLSSEDEQKKEDK